MNTDNFIVRMHLDAVERFQQVDNWETLSESDRATLKREVAGLPSQIETDDIESRLFDLTALRMQLALTEDDAATFDKSRKRVVEIALLLEEKGSIPAVAAQLAYLAELQGSAFWEGIDLAELEDLRQRLRGLMPLRDMHKRTIVVATVWVRYCFGHTRLTKLFSSPQFPLNALKEKRVSALLVVPHCPITKQNRMVNAQVPVGWE